MSFTIKLVNYTQYLLTCVEITVLGEVLGHSVELVGSVVATVAVKFDTGGEVNHQGGQGGDLIQHVFVVLQHPCHVGFDKQKKEIYW